jgi:hypothetical protein
VKVHQRCAEVILTASGSYEATPIIKANRAASDSGKMLTVSELAALMNVKESWVHHHSADFPFAIRLPGQKRVNRYSYAGYLRWLRSLEDR